MSRTQNTHKYNVDLKEPDLLEQALIGMGKVDGEHATRMLGILERRKSGLEHKRDRTQVKLTHRKKVLLEQRQRYQIKRQEMESALRRMELSSDKFNDLTMSVRALSTELSNISSVTAQSVRSIRSVADIVNNETAMRSRLTMLSFIEGSLDTAFPLRYELKDLGDNRYAQSLYWVTMRNPVGWVDRCSDVKHTSLSEFGPFVVCVRRTISSTGSAMIAAYVRMMHSDATETRSDFSGWADLSGTMGRQYIHSGGHPHPHVSSDGIVCLGDSQTALLRQMESSDYAQVVQTIMLILTQYNSRDPYRQLYDYELVPHGESDGHNASIVCGNCSQLHVKCCCVKSSVSGAVMQSFERSPCGCTIAECVNNHERYSVGSDRSYGAGINGTWCFPLRDSPDYPVTGAGKEHPGVSSKAVVFEEAIKVLGSPDFRDALISMAQAT